LPLAATLRRSKPPCFPYNQRCRSRVPPSLHMVFLPLPSGCLAPPPFFAFFSFLFGPILVLPFQKKPVETFILIFFVPFRCIAIFTPNLPYRVCPPKISSPFLNVGDLLPPVPPQIFPPPPRVLGLLTLISGQAPLRPRFLSFDLVRSLKALWFPLLPRDSRVGVSSPLFFSLYPTKETLALPCRSTNSPHWLSPFPVSPFYDRLNS